MPYVCDQFSKGFLSDLKPHKTHMVSGSLSFLLLAGAWTFLWLMDRWRKVAESIINLLGPPLREEMVVGKTFCKGWKLLQHLSISFLHRASFVPCVIPMSLFCWRGYGVKSPLFTISFFDISHPAQAIPCFSPHPCVFSFIF